MSTYAAPGIFRTELDEAGESLSETTQTAGDAHWGAEGEWEDEDEGDWEDEGEWERETGGERETEGEWDDTPGRSEHELGSPFAAREDEGPRGGRPLLVRGSRGSHVARAQRLLNRVLPRHPTVPRGCVHRSSRDTQAMIQELRVLQRHGQLPLVVDGRFGPQTERAVRIFQGCLGLVRDGKVGPVTWTYLERQRGGGGGRPPHPQPEPRTCGLPDRSAAELEQAVDLEAEMLGETRTRRGTSVRPRLSLFLNDSTSAARNHFQCQASRVARRLGALQVGRDNPCTTRRVGPTSFDTGADIVGAITSAHSCLRRRLGAVHIFGHSGPGGIYGADISGREGLYTSIGTGAGRSGAREIGDVPAAALADDVVVVLHGCNQGAGTDSFAEQLYRHLRATLRVPVVLAHYNGGCAGRDNSWIRFDNRSPNGRRVRSIAPHYTGNGCCERTPRRRELADDEVVADGSEWEEEWSAEGGLEEASYGGGGCGCRH